MSHEHEINMLAVGLVADYRAESLAQRRAIKRNLLRTDPGPQRQVAIKALAMIERDEKAGIL